MNKFILIFLCLWSNNFAFAQEIKKIPKETENYFQLMEKFNQPHSQISIAELYSSGLKSAEALVRVAEIEDIPNWDKKLKGFKINEMAGSIYYSVDIPFFLNLSKQKGNSIDKDFFQLIQDTKPRNFRFVFEQGASDYGSCVNFGAGKYTTTLMKWLNFQKKYSNDYKEVVRDNINEILDELDRLCACDHSIEPVKEELKKFEKIVPDKKATSKVQKILKTIEENSSGNTKNKNKDIILPKLDCIPG